MKKGEMKMSDIQSPSLDEKKLNQMKVEILRIEQNNLKTKEQTNESMAESIRKIIVTEVNKTY